MEMERGQNPIILGVLSLPEDSEEDKKEGEGEKVKEKEEEEVGEAK